MIYVDVETLGFHGPTILIQWAIDDGPITLHNIWLNKIKDTLDLIQMMVDNEGYIGFNITFDWFHICKLATTLMLFPNHDIRPIDHVPEFIEFESFARNGKCLKPKAALDLMLYARRGPYQSTMPRHPILIKRVPSVIAHAVAEELHKRIPLKPILFAKRKIQLSNPWQVEPIDGDPDFKNIKLRFDPSSALKALAADALGIEENDILLMSDLDPLPQPREYGFAPFTKAADIAFSKDDEKKATWPELLEMHINEWERNPKRRKYAADDIVYTRGLYNYFGRPPVGDNDSELACMVGAVRWKGFAIDLEGIKILKAKARAAKYVPCAKCADTDNRCSSCYAIPTAASNAKPFLEKVLSDDEKTFMEGSTKKVILERFAKGKLWNEVECNSCGGTGETSHFPNGTQKCSNCQGKGVARHPVSERAEMILKARMAGWEEDLYKKLLLAKRFHFSTSVIGALSSRMGGSGAAKGVEGGGRAKGDRLNGQGIKRTKEVRRQFTLADPDQKLCGGDFNSFEISIIHSIYQPKWMEKILNEGKTPITFFAMDCFPGVSYEDILKSKGNKDLDYYERGKRGFYAFCYGGNSFTIQERVNIDKDAADDAERKFLAKNPEMKKRRDEITLMFAAMRQPGGIGSKVEWHGTKEYMESPLGFRRYFTLENQIRKALFDLAEKPPKTWSKIKIKVRRRDREQWVEGAARSAVFAAAFAIQGDITRAAVNHEIQSFGAEVTKHVQRKIWDMQPSGIHDWIVQPMNVHDEILCPTHPNYVDELKVVVDQTVESFKSKIPLISIDWKTGINNWAEK